MKRQIILSALFAMTVLLVVVSCQKDNDCIERIDVNCTCTEEYDPVLGCNGKIYDNPCYAKCAGISYQPYVCELTPPYEVK